MSTGSYCYRYRKVLSWSSCKRHMSWCLAELTLSLQEGFVSTHEAVARALVHLEGGGPELLDTLLAPLRLMTALQVARPWASSQLLAHPVLA